MKQAIIHCPKCNTYHPVDWPDEMSMSKKYRCGPCGGWATIQAVIHDSRNAKGEATYALPDRFPPVPLPKP